MAELREYHGKWDFTRTGEPRGNVTDSVRPVAGAPVATPLDWSELDDPKLHARQYSVGNIADRLADGDPWGGFRRRGPSVTAARRRPARVG
jgi:bifunctional non-homologous end joining protein LigD